MPWRHQEQICVLWKCPIWRNLYFDYCLWWKFHQNDISLSVFVLYTTLHQKNLDTIDTYCALLWFDTGQFYPYPPRYLTWYKDNPCNHNARKQPWSIRVNMMTSSNGNISALLALCEGNPLVTSGFPSQHKGQWLVAPPPPPPPTLRNHMSDVTRKKWDSPLISAIFQNGRLKIWDFQYLGNYFISPSYCN